MTEDSHLNLPKRMHEVPKPIPGWFWTKGRESYDEFVEAMRKQRSTIDELHFKYLM